MAVSFIGGGNRSTQKKNTDLPQVTGKVSHNVVSSISRLSGVRTHNVSGVGTDCIGSCKYNYHTITTNALSEVIKQP